jgi:hypothetical protein
VANLTLDSFRRYVEPYATGVSYFELLFNTQEVLRDFCARTKCWQTLLAAFPTVAGTSDYTLTSPTGGLVSQVEEVYYIDNKVEFTPMDDLGRWYQQNWRTLSNGTPVWATFMEPGILTLHNTPEAAGNLYVRAAIIPDNTLTLAAVEFPDFIFTRWASQIADGVLARLYNMPDKPYSDVKRADAKTVRYEQYVASVKIRVARSFGRQELETTPQFF